MSELYKERNGETWRFVPFLKTKTDQVDDVDSLYAKIQKKNIPIKIELRDEPWGDRHFAIEDPNGIGIDIVRYLQPL